MRERFIFERSYYEAIKVMPKKMRHDFIDGLLSYVFEGTMPEDEQSAAMINIIKVQLDGDILSYENYHQRVSTDYRQWKKAVLDRDKHICQKCGSDKDIHAHHIKPFSEYPELRFDVNNGITLCKECHIKEHKNER